MKPSDNGEGKYSPINLTGENALDYKHIRDFIMLKKKGLLLEKDCVEEYSNATNNEVEIVEANLEDDKVKVFVLQSLSSYKNIRSYIGYLYKINRLPRPSNIQDQLSIFIAGKKRPIRKEKQQLGLHIGEGKKAMAKLAYELFAKHFLGGRDKHVFAHLFLVLDWCLMKRAKNCVNAKINHIYFRNDSLVFEIAKSKSL